MGYKAREYWEDRLKNKFSIAGTGHSGFSERYNRYMYALRERALERAIKKYRIDIKDKSILDVGCGTGFFVKFYEEKGAREITGIDITDVSVSGMRERFPSHSFFRLDIGQSDVGPGGFVKKFDIINVFDVLYHVVDDSAFRRSVANISEWSKDGAWILISDSLDPSKGAAEHVRYRTREFYADILRGAGIAIEGVEPIFRLMGQGVRPGMKDGIFKKIAAKAIEASAWAAYGIDSVYCPVERSTMRLLVCRKR